MSRAIVVSLDQAGRLVVPKSVRDEAGFRPGMPLRIAASEGRIEIEAVPRDVRIVDRDGFCVAEPTERGPELTTETVRRTRREVRSRRRSS